MFEGTFTALPTPFSKGRIDLPRLTELVHAQVRAGVDGIVPAGTTGESPTLDASEHLEVIETAVRAAAGKLKVIAGTGGNSTREAIHLTQGAERLGADASLQVTPYYNKPTQEGLFQHFCAIARSTNLPLVLYSIPGRCQVSISIKTILRLHKLCKNIVAIKEAGGDADRVSQLRQDLDSRFTILSGDDSLTLPFMALGAKGVISVASNLVPEEVCRMVALYSKGDHRSALAIHDRLYPLFKALFVEINPIPIKTAMALAGKIEPGLRLPLTPMSKENLPLIKEALNAVNINI